MDSKALASLVTGLGVGLGLLNSSLPSLVKWPLAALALAATGWWGWMYTRAARREAAAHAQTSAQPLGPAFFFDGCDTPLKREASAPRSGASEWNTSTLPGRHGPPARPTSPPVYASAPRIVRK